MKLFRKGDQRMNDRHVEGTCPADRLEPSLSDNENVLMQSVCQ